jgi:hypothetical protein
MVVLETKGNYHVLPNSATLLRNCQRMFHMDKCFFSVSEVYAALMVTSQAVALETYTGCFLRSLMQLIIQSPISCPDTSALAFIALHLRQRTYFRKQGRAIAEAWRYDLPSKGGILTKLERIPEPDIWVIGAEFDDLSGCAFRYGTLTQLVTSFPDHCN